MFVAVGAGASGSYSIAYSYNGVNWTGVTDSTTNIFQSGKSVTWTGNKWMAVGNTPYSYDGINWFGVPNSNSIFTPSQATIISSNSQIGYAVVDSAIVLNNNTIPTSQTLDLVSASYNDASFTNFNTRVTAYDLQN